jgi:hypothetical protein
MVVTLAVEVVVAVEVGAVAVEVVAVEVVSAWIGSPAGLP